MVNLLISALIALVIVFGVFTIVPFLMLWTEFVAKKVLGKDWP